MAQSVDAELLVAALAGYEETRRQIEIRIAELRQRVGNARPLTFQTTVLRPPRKHVISAGGRARIAAAQKKRWKAAKNAKAERPGPKQGPKQAASPKRTKGVTRATVSAAKRATRNAKTQSVIAKRQIGKRAVPAKTAVKRTTPAKSAAKSVSRPRPALKGPMPKSNASPEAISPVVDGALGL